MKLHRCCFGAVAALSMLLSVRAQVVAPKPVTTPSPGYPAELTDTGLSGMAKIEFTVSADGGVADAKLVSTDHPAFGAAALAVIGQWKFEPGTRDGNATAMNVTLPFNFRAPPEQQMNAQLKRKVFVELKEPVLTAKDYGAKLKVKKEAKPVYPKTLARSGVKESVKVSFVVAPDGTTLNPKLEGQPRQEFIMAAYTAIAQTTYQPPLKDGKGVYVEATTTLKFEEAAPERSDRGDRTGGGGRGGRGGGGMGGGMGGGRSR